MYAEGLILRVAEAAGRAVLYGEADPSEVVIKCPRSARHKNGDSHPSCRLSRAKNTFFCDPCGRGGGARELAELLGVDLSTLTSSGRAASKPQRQARRSVSRQALSFDSTGPISMAIQSEIANRLGKRYSPETWARVRVHEGQVGREPAIGFPLPGGGWKACLYRRPDQARGKGYSWRTTDGGKASLLLVGEGPEVLLAAGEWDMLSALAAGFPCVATGTGGEGTWKPEWSAQLAGKRATIVYDVDEAGCTGARTVASRLAGVAAEVFIVKLPLSGDPDGDGKDLSDFLALHDTAALRELLGKTTAEGPLFSIDAEAGSEPDPRPSTTESVLQQIDELLKSVPKDGDTVFKADVFRRVLPLLLHLDPAAQDLAARDVKSRLGIGLATIRKAVEVGRQSNQTGPAKNTPAPPSPESDALLHDPDLVRHFLDDTTTLGVVGEEGNRTILFLAMTSRLCQQPLNVAVKAESSAGKNYLADTVARCFPQDQVVRITALSPQALNYWDVDLRGKVLLIAEVEGSDRAEYSLRVLQSEGSLNVHYVSKVNGQLKTVERTVRGPTATVTTTTRESLHPENETRLIEITLDESSEQTGRILKFQAQHRLQRRSPETVQAITARWAGAQALLEPHPVVIPYAECIQFSPRRVRARRDFPKLLNLTEASAFLHQFQRERTEIDGVVHIVADLRDYEIAYNLLHAFLERVEAGLNDRELQVLDRLREVAPEAGTVRDMAELLGWHAEAGRKRAKRALDSLVEKGWADDNGARSGVATRYMLAQVGPSEGLTSAGLSTPEDVALAWAGRSGHLDRAGQVTCPGLKP